MRDIATELREDYPQLYPSSLADSTIRLPEGWADIVRQLSHRLKDKPIVVDQVKEKWGGLRWYFTGEVDAEISRAIAEAMDASYVTCDVCALPGHLRSMPNPVRASGRDWICVRCEDHAEGSPTVDPPPQRAKT